jgi:hypothetical protein
MRGWSYAGALGVWVLGSVLGSSSASAQGDPPSSEAERLFEEARQLAAHGHFDDACSRFEASEAIEPAVGTLLNLADCAERRGATATAWRRYDQAASLAARNPDDERRALATRKSAELGKRLSKLVLRASRGVWLPETVVRRDGEPVPSDELGQEVAVDPGVYTLDASAPGYLPWKSAVTVAPGPVVVFVEIPILSKQGQETREANGTSRAGVVAGRPLSRPPGDSGSAQRTWALISGGVSLVGLGLGTYFALEARAVWGDVLTQCPNKSCPNEATLLAETPREQEAMRDGVIGTVALAVGATALVTGAVLYFARPSSNASAIRLVPILDPHRGSSVWATYRF